MQFSIAKYTVEDKLQAVERYLNGNESANKIANLLGLKKAIFKWVKQYETQGLNALQSKKKGRPSMKKEYNKQLKQTLVKGSTEAIEARMKQLEIEYLKNLTP